jgi:aminoglycoside 3-N-acetyltransferase I
MVASVDRSRIDTVTGSPLSIRRLTASDIKLVRELLVVFGNAFDDTDTYIGAQPNESYLERLLASDCFIALAAQQGDKVVGGVAAYELQKLEQQRSEIYIYDLAVAAEHRRRGVATGLIAHLRDIARARGAYVIFVQADYTDPPAIALYNKLGTEESVLHFDISVK